MSPVTALLSTVLLALPAEPAQPRFAGPVVVDEPSAEDRIVADLRLLRDPEAPGPAELAAGLRDAAPEASRFLLQVLHDEVVPPLAADDERQQLSVVQRELLLELFRELPARDVRELVEGWYLAAPTPSRLATSVRVLGTSDRVADMRRMLALVRSLTDDQLTRDTERALRESVAELCARDLAFVDALEADWFRVDPDLMPLVVRGAGDSREPAVGRVLLAVGYGRRDLRDLALAQLSAIGAPPDPELRSGLEELARLMLSEPNVAAVRRGCLALGDLDCEDAVDVLVEHLDHGDRGVVQSAHWALTEITGLDLGLEPETWRSWIEFEREWWSERGNLMSAMLHERDAAAVAGAIREISGHPLLRSTLHADLRYVLLSGPHAVRPSACHAARALGARDLLPLLDTLLESPQSDLSDAARVAALELLELDPELDADGLHAWLEPRLR